MDLLARIPLLLAVLISVAWPSGAILCLEQDGSVALELPTSGCCLSDSESPSRSRSADCSDCADQVSSPARLVVVCPGLQTPGDWHFPVADTRGLPQAAYPDSPTRRTGLSPGAGLALRI